MAYTPPEGNLVPLAFTGGAYTPPFGGEVALNFGDIAPPVDAQYIVPGGWIASGYGVPALENIRLAVYPGGIAPPPATGPNEFRQLPDPTIAWRYQFAYPPSIAAPAFPVHDVSHYTRWIDQAGRGTDFMALGTPRIEYTLRTVEPAFIYSMIFGSALIAHNRLVYPVGWENPTSFGLPQLDINLQRLRPTGIPPTVTYGEPDAKNQREFLRLTGIDSLEPGFPIVENFKRYLYVAAYADGHEPTGWANYAPDVENKIKYSTTQGWQSSKFSVIGTVIENKARAVTPVGWESFFWAPGNFIGHYTRYITPNGLDEFVSLRYHNIANTASVVAPSGWDSSAFGTPSDVRNLNRTVKHHSGPADGFYGTPFIAYGVRTVYPRVFNDQYLPIPEVRFNPHPFKPAGIDSLRTGTPVVYEHFNILGAKSANVHSVPWVGEPFIRNRNQTLKVYPSDQALYGRPTVFNYDSYLTIGAGDLSKYGSHLIEFRTKTLKPAPISVPTFTTVHRIRNLLPDPPFDQRLIPTGISEWVIPKPTVIVRGLFPTGIAPENISAPHVQGNGIFPISIVFDDSFGFPNLVGTQFLYPTSVPTHANIPDPLLPPPTPTGSSDENWTKNHNRGYEFPRLSPHMIYAPLGEDKTTQAVENNPPYPEPDYHKMDGRMAPGYGESRYPFFGNTWISLKHRIIGPVPTHGVGADKLDPSSEVGTGAVVDLRVRYVFPEGIRSMRFGRAVMWGAPQYVYLDLENNGIPPGDKYIVPAEGPPYPPSIHTVGFPPLFHRPVFPVGFAGAMGAAQIELFNREVAPQGIPHGGNPQLGDTNPWGTALVGFPRVYVLDGFDATLWGDTWVSHYTRAVYPEGFNSLSLENSFIPEFDARMRVRLYNHPKLVTGVGQIEPPAIPLHLVEPVDRGILGRGWKSLIITAPHITLRIDVPGWESLEVGDVDKWEAGKIKPHGDDLSGVGFPKLLHPLAPSSIDDSVLGIPRTGACISPLGLPAIGFAGPSVTDIYGCSLRIVTPLPVLSTQIVAVPEVAHV